MIIARGTHKVLHVQFFWDYWRLEWWRANNEWGLQIGPFATEWSNVGT